MSIIGISSMKDEIFQYLAVCPIFHNVSSERLAEILNNSECRLEKYSAGTMIRQQGDLYERLLLLIEGRLEARFESTTGKSMIVEHFEAPTMVASAVLMCSEPVLPVTLSAEDEVVLVTIGYDAMLSLLADEPKILKAFLADAGDKIRFLAEKIRLLRFRSLRVKIAEHLLALSAQQGTEGPRWRYGREQMADLLGAARPSLSRELSKMADEGLIEMSDRSMVLLNIEALREIVNED